MANAYIPRETAGSIYRSSLIKDGITDPRLLDGMVEDFLRTTYDKGPGIKAFPGGGSSAYNASDSKAVPAPSIIPGMGMPTASSTPPTISGMGMPTPSPPVTKDDYIPPNFGNGTNVFTPNMQTGLPPVGTTINSVPPAATVPNPNLRGSAGADTIQGGSGGFDPLPQTSGHTDITSRTGQESMNPAQAALLEKLLAAQRMV